MNFQVEWMKATDVYQQHLFLLKKGSILSKNYKSLIWQIVAFGFFVQERNAPSP